MLPEFQFGDEVRIVRNVRNDGTYPGMPTGELLIRRGSTGFVMNVGTFLQDQLIYTVNFVGQDRIVGCREEELISIDDPWIPSRFESREKVRSRVTLAVQGEVRAAAGAEGEVLRVLRDDAGGVQYQVIFRDRVLQVPESALEAGHADEKDKDNDAAG